MEGRETGGQDRRTGVVGETVVREAEEGVKRCGLVGGKGRGGGECVW